MTDDVLHGIPRLDMDPGTFSEKKRFGFTSGDSIRVWLNEQQAGAGGFSGLMDPKPIELPAEGTKAHHDLLGWIREQGAGSDEDDPEGPRPDFHASFELTIPTSGYHGIPGASYELLRIEITFLTLCMGYHQKCRGLNVHELHQLHRTHLNVICMIINAERAMHMSGQSDRIRPELATFVRRIRKEAARAIEDRL